MDFAELQNMWQQYDKKLSDNTRLNKEILKKILILKPEKQINWLRVKEGVYLILPLILIPLVLLKGVHLRMSIDFFSGVFLFSFYSILVYYWSLKYFLMLSKVDFKNSVIDLKKAINILEKYEIKKTKLSYFLIPFGIIGVFLMCNIPLFAKDSFLPIILMLIVWVISFYYRYKFSIIEQFKKINNELIELENLEK